MKTVSKSVSIVFLGLCVTIGAAAQKIGYLQTRYLKVAPEKETEFAETLHADFSKVVHEVFATPTRV